MWTEVWVKLFRVEESKTLSFGGKFRTSRNFPQKSQFSDSFNDSHISFARRLQKLKIFSRNVTRLSWATAKQSNIKFIFVLTNLLLRF